MARIRGMPSFWEWPTKDLAKYLSNKNIANIPKAREARITACFFAHTKTANAAKWTTNVVKRNRKPFKAPTKKYRADIKPALSEADIDREMMRDLNLWIVHCTNCQAEKNQDNFRLDMETLELYWAKIADMGLSHCKNMKAYWKADSRNSTSSS